MGVHLRKGSAAIHVQFFERGGGGTLYVDWAGPGFGKRRMIWQPASRHVRRHVRRAGSLRLWYPGQRRVSRNALIRRVNTASQFNLSFDVYPQAKQNGWRNILHFTKRGNCCGQTDRIPGVWMYSRSTRLHIRMARPGSGNDGCDPGQQLALNRWTNVRIMLSGSVLRVFYNGRQVCANGRYGRKVAAQRNVKMYTGDPWFHSMRGYIRRIKYTAIGGRRVVRRHVARRRASHHGFYAQYYRNIHHLSNLGQAMARTRRARPVATRLVRHLSYINHSWLRINRSLRDNFVAKFTGRQGIPRTGWYTFWTGSDDGSNLYVNGRLVVNNDGLHGTRWRAGRVHLRKGSAAIHVQFFERGGGATLYVDWAGPGFGKRRMVWQAPAGYRETLLETKSST